MKAPLPPNEKERLDALKLYGILDTLPEASFDEITRVAAHICACPIATISIIEENRQWYKSKVGMDAEETPRDIAFCAHTIAAGKPVIVEDATKDVRFADNPVVLEGPKVRFYAGMPLTNKEGHALGTLCVVDTRSRQLSPEQTLALEALSRHVITHLDLRRALIERAQAEAEVKRLNESLEQKVIERTAELTKAYGEIKAATQAKTEFLTTMSHEIRTPLNAIIGMTELLTGTAFDDEQRDFLETIHANSENLLAIIDDVLDLSKIEFGKLELEVRPFSPSDLVGDLLKMFRHRAAQKNLALHAHIAPELPATCLGDVTRLRQVLVNLVSNALKFTTQGHVKIEVSGTTSTINDPGASVRLRFSIHDTGIGIAADRMDRLFKAFSQVDASTTRLYGGTGLGLTICQKLVELMGGAIHVETQPGRGSTFSFDLALPPANGLLVASPPPEAGAAIPSRPLDILLVEDNPTNQKVAQSVLRRLGYRADVATDGLEAIDSVRRKNYDLIFMDVHMPNLDGFGATQKIRELQAGAGPWIVALTADVLKGEREKCLAVGMDDFISKPLSLAAIEKIIDETLATLNHRR